MGNTNINPKLKKKIKEWLKDNNNQFIIPNEVAFINKACYELLQKLKRERRKYNHS